MTEYTPNINLDLYENTDKPNLRDQYNSSMGKLDTILSTPFNSAQLADGAVTSAKLGDGAVTTAKLADNSVTADKIAPGALTAADIADGAITAGKIADAAVTSDKIINGAITTDKIADGSITSAKLANVLKYGYYSGVIIGHQGLVNDLCGNTLQSFQLAKKCNIDFVECDVRKTGDGEFVLAHDDTLSSYTAYTGNISATDYSTIVQYPITKGNNASYLPANTVIPKFEDFLKLCVAEDLVPIIEIKGGSNITDTDMQSIMSLVEAYGFINEAAIISFHQPHLLAALSYYRYMKTCYLSSTYSNEIVDWAVSHDVKAIMVPVSVINSTAINYAHASNVAIGVYNGAIGDMIAMKKLAVDFINVDGARWLLPSEDQLATDYDSYNVACIGSYKNHPIFSKWEMEQLKRNMMVPINGTSWQLNSNGNLIGNNVRNRMSILPVKVMPSTLVDISIPTSYKAAFIFYDKTFTTRYDDGWIGSGDTIIMVPSIYGSKNAPIYMTITVARTDDGDMGAVDYLFFKDFFAIGGLSPYFRYGTNNNRICSKQFAVNAGDTYKYTNSSTFQVGIRVFRGSTQIADSGWLSADYTIPSNASSIYVILKNISNNDRINSNLYDDAMETIEELMPSV